MQTRDLPITGMDCADCARTIERGVGQMEGVAVCSINFGAARLGVQFDPQLVDEQAIVTRIRSLGYDIDTAVPASVPQIGALPSFMRFVLARKTTSAPLLIGAILLLLAAALGWWAVSDTLAYYLEILALLIAGTPIAWAGLRALFYTRQVTINLLMTLAAIGAVVIGEAAEAATVVVLFALGEALEGFSMQRSRDSLQGLMRLAPAEATVLEPCMDCASHLGRDGYTGGPCLWCGPHEQRVPVGQVASGQIVLVRPGERIPLDGVVAQGDSAVDQKHITGESIPVERSTGGQVYAGSINGTGALEIQVTNPASESLLSRIAEMVAQAQARRAPVERFMDRFAAIYTPAVVVVALLFAAVPPLLFQQPFWNTAAGDQGWLYRALALLVIACPCALVISTPVTIVSALSAATRAGALVKGGAALEALRRVRVIAFDKTGTLTTGHPQVTAIQCADECCRNTPAGCAHCDELLALAAAVERQSAHPLALAVVKAAESRGLAGRYSAVESVMALPGRGVQGRVSGRKVTIGSHSLFDAEHAHDPALCTRVTAAELRGQTALLVCACDDGGVQGYITVADTPREDSRRTLAELRGAGIERTIVLTGDNAAAGQAIAARVGADEVRAGLLPGDKLAAIQALREQYGGVAMVGDGVNDTPALAAATVGIAMGAAGSAQALDAADIALMGDDLSRLPFLIRLSRQTGRIIGQNIGLSLGIKALFLILALGGWASLWGAVLADTGVSLLVTLNGMRMLREK